ncbi:DegT/DnrJ/EryC1/StrS aminotransferase family protein [Paenibacillus taihuensis]|uniref:DegT/DnrJ/EryC1/StrS aminotransferase family protein n=1 Tax=Paenibacillus taihuensis TaxID=1156355 RepID=A0A3D9R1W1_9BACL|nr:DegT/DnrJ/EryC1/StrS family aminotransferase [Paenibacillus taihuensis]REE68668.1 DegT/DnrJ/EryC1/StrS aminotransferase family protein [Paenibacillus taihuensis]
MLEKRGVTAHDNPWTCASYKGNVQYSREMCPDTLNWLGRAVAISLHQRMTEEDVSDVVRAIRKAAGVQ